MRASYQTISICPTPKPPLRSPASAEVNLKFMPAHFISFRETPHGSAVPHAGPLQPSHFPNASRLLRARLALARIFHSRFKGPTRCQAGLGSGEAPTCREAPCSVRTRSRTTHRFSHENVRTLPPLPRTGPCFAKRTSLVGKPSRGGPACGTLGRGEGDRSSDLPISQPPVAHPRLHPANQIHQPASAPFPLSRERERAGVRAKPFTDSGRGLPDYETSALAPRLLAAALLLLFCGLPLPGARAAVTFNVTTLADSHAASPSSRHRPQFSFPHLAAVRPRSRRCHQLPRRLDHSPRRRN